MYALAAFGVPALEGLAGTFAESFAGDAGARLDEGAPPPPKASGMDSFLPEVPGTESEEIVDPDFFKGLGGTLPSVVLPPKAAGMLTVFFGMAL